MKTARGQIPAWTQRLVPSGAESPVVAVWSRLSTIDTLGFTVRSVKGNGPGNYQGSGHVRIVWVGDSAVEFEEAGRWQYLAGKPIHFRNVYRWVKSEDSHSLNLYHRRNGALDPEFLCTFSPLQHGVHLRATPHICGQDLYHGDLLVRSNLIELRWKITGPKKNDILTISYSRSLHREEKILH